MLLRRWGLGFLLGCGLSSWAKDEGDKTTVVNAEDLETKIYSEPVCEKPLSRRDNLNPQILFRYADPQMRAILRAWRPGLMVNLYLYYSKRETRLAAAEFLKSLGNPPISGDRLAVLGNLPEPVPGSGREDYLALRTPSPHILNLLMEKFPPQDIRPFKVRGRDILRRDRDPLEMIATEDRPIWLHLQEHESDHEATLILQYWQDPALQDYLIAELQEHVRGLRIQIGNPLIQEGWIKVEVTGSTHQLTELLSRCTQELDRVRVRSHEKLQTGIVGRRDQKTPQAAR
jgi:hypothetical protein